MNTFHRFLSSFSVKAATLCAAFALLAPTAVSAQIYIKAGDIRALSFSSANETTGISSVGVATGTNVNAGSVASTSASYGSTINYTAPNTTGTVVVSATQAAGTHSAVDYCAQTSNLTLTVVSAVSVSSQPTAQSCIMDAATPPNLTVTATGGTGTGYTYQWYVCDDAVKTNATTASGTGATTASFHPAVNATSSKYYYCVITDNGLSSNTVTSNVVQYTVSSCLAAPSITCAALSIPANRAGQLFPSSASPGAFTFLQTTTNGWAETFGSIVTGSNAGTGTETVKITQAAGGGYCPNETGINVTVTLTAAVPDTLHALVGQTYSDVVKVTSSNTTASSITVSSVNSKGTVSPTTTAHNNNISYSATAAGDDYIRVSQSSNATYCADTYDFPVKVVAAITASGPSGATYSVDDVASSLSVTPSGGSGAYAYQWYSCTAANKSGSAIIPGETSATYAGAKISTASEGHQYYYCIVSEANASFPAQSCTTAVADIEVVEEVAKMCYEVTATWTSTTATTITGAKSGGPFGFVTSAQKTLQEQPAASSPCDFNRYKLNGAGAYVALNGTFKIGDTVTMVGNAPNTGYEPFQISNGTNTTSIATPLFSTPGDAACGTYAFVLTANTSAIYFYRANKGGSSSGGDDQNPCIRSITVKRCCDSVGVANLTTSQAVACGTNVTLAPTVVGATSYQWYTCSDPADSIATKAAIGGATSSSYTVSSVSALNNYFLIASNAAGCADTSNVASIAPVNGTISVTLAASDAILNGETENVTLPSLEVGYSDTHFALEVANTASSGTTLQPCFAHTPPGGSGVTLTSDEAGASVVSSCGSITGGSSTTYYLQIPAGLDAGTYNGSIVITDSRGASACAQGLTLNYTFSVKVPINVHFTGSCLTPITSNAGASVTIGGNTTSGTDASGVITVYADPDTEASLTAFVSGMAFKWWDNIEHSTSNPYAVSVESSAIDIYVNFSEARDPVVVYNHWKPKPTANTRYGESSDVNLKALNAGSTTKLSNGSSDSTWQIGYTSSYYLTYTSKDGVDFSSLDITTRLKDQKTTSSYIGKGTYLNIIPYSDTTASVVNGDTLKPRFLDITISSISTDSSQSVSLPSGTMAVKIMFVTSGSSSDYAGYLSYLAFRKGSEALPEAASHISPITGSTDVDTTSTIVVALGNKPYWSDGAGNVTQATTGNSVSHISITKYNGSAYVDATSEFNSAATAYNDPDTDGDNDSIRVVFTPKTIMTPGTYYKVQVSDLVNCEGTEVSDSILSTFQTEAAPVPVIGVFNASKSAMSESQLVNFGTVFHKSGVADAVSVVFGIKNIGTGTLKIDSLALSGYYQGTHDAEDYKITKVQKNHDTPLYDIATGKRLDDRHADPVELTGSDTLYVTATFKVASAAGAIGTYADTLRVFAKQEGGLPEVAVRSLRLSASVAGFVLPYTYQSGLQNPIATSEELSQDYAALSDIPVEISVPTPGSGVGYRVTPGASSGLFPEYNVYSSEGACARNGQSALRVGSDNSEAGKNDYSLLINLDHSTNNNIKGTIGTLTIGWSAGGSRKLLVTSGDGSTEYLATDWLAGRRCYTHSVDIHNCTSADDIGSTSVKIQLIAADTAALSTINYLNITPCDPEFISSKCDLLNIGSECTDGSFQIADNIVTLRVDKDDATCYSGNCSGAEYTGSSFVANVLEVSPGATVTPGIGVAASQNAQGYYVYTVTAEDGFTSKEYLVNVQCPVSGTGGVCYGDTIAYSVNMNTEEKTLHVLYIGEGNGSGEVNCLAPVASAVNSTHTIHYLTPEDKPDSYIISGPSSLCVGSVGEYELSNAPESNNPKYTWIIGGLAATPSTHRFSIVGGELITSGISPFDGVSRPDSIWYRFIGEKLRLQAPEVIAEGTVKVDLNINLGFEDEKCSVISGDATLNVFASLLPPTSVKAVSADCKLANGNLEIRAIRPTVGDSIVVVDEEDTNPVISATSFSFDFLVNGSADDGDLLERSMVISDTTVTVTLAKTAPNLDVVVLAKNGCGTISSERFPVNYGSSATTWTGAVSSAWNNRGNWTAQVPTACTDAYIPQIGTSGTSVNDIAYTVTNYPEISAAAACDSIVFLPGGGVKGLQHLTYNRAVVKQTFDRNTWYTLTAPLHQMYTGDYYYQGKPSANIKFYNTANPDNAKAYHLAFTSGIVGLNYDLNPGQGFAYQVSNLSYVGNFRTSSQSTPQSVTLPRTTASGVLIPSYYKFSTYTGNPYGSPYDVTRTDNQPYRLAFDKNLTEGAANFGTIDTTFAQNGYHLIGNPLMTHLDFDAFQAANSSVIGNVIKLWNNHYNTATSIVVNGEGENLGAAAGTSTIVPPAQSFFVNVTSTANALTFNPAASYFVAPANSANIHMRADEAANTLYIIADDGTTKSYASLRNSDLASNDYVSDEDAVKLFSGHTLSEIYTLTSGKPVDVNQFNAVNIDIPVGVRNLSQKADTASTRLTFNGAETFENQSVYLLNTLTGDSIDLKLQNSYEFRYDAAHQEGALYLVFRSAEVVDTVGDDTPTDIEEVADNSGINISVRGGNTVRVISSASDPIRDVEIYTASGALIVKQSNVNASLRDVTLNAGQRTVIVRAVTSNAVKTKEVLLY
ncbi:MAG: hypothetical protein IJR32_02980 [Paludibacteraceae bacterium]|nr:hypothetical protein [Paludibacteraceae bacterium]